MLLETRLEINALGVIAFRQLTWMMVVRKEVAEVSSIRTERKQAMSFAAMMVHVDVERDSEQRVQLALEHGGPLPGHAHRRRRFGAAPSLRRRCRRGLYSTRPSRTEKVAARLDEMGTIPGPGSASQSRSSGARRLNSPFALVSSEARAADLVIAGPDKKGTTCMTSSIPARSCCGRGGPSWWCPMSSRRSSSTARSWRGKTPGMPPRRARRVPVPAGGQEVLCSKSANTKPNRRPGKILPTSPITLFVIASSWRPSLAAGPRAGRDRAPSSCPERERRSGRGRRLWAQPTGRMDFRRRDA